MNGYGISKEASVSDCMYTEYNVDLPPTWGAVLMVTSDGLYAVICAAHAIFID